MAITHRTLRKVPATPRNLALDARRKKKFEQEFLRWEKKFRAAIKKKSTKQLQVHLDQLCRIVIPPAFGPILNPHRKKGKGRKR